MNTDDERRFLVTTMEVPIILEVNQKMKSTWLEILCRNKSGSVFESVLQLDRSAKLRTKQEVSDLFVNSKDSCGKDDNILEVSSAREYTEEENIEYKRKSSCKHS